MSFCGFLPSDRKVTVLPVLLLPSPSPIPLKAFIKSGVSGYIRAAMLQFHASSGKSHLSTSLHNQNENRREAICVIYYKITTQLLHPSPSIYSPMMKLCHRQWCWLLLSLLWSHSKQNAVSGFVRLGKKQQLSSRHIKHFFLHYSITCCFFGFHPWCSCSQHSLHLWT